MASELLIQADEAAARAPKDLQVYRGESTSSPSTFKANYGTAFSTLLSESGRFVVQSGRCVVQSVDGLAAADPGRRGGRLRAQKPPGQTNALYLQ